MDNLEASVYEVPTDQPEADGTITWSSTTMVLFRATGGGATGLGYTYAGTAAKSVIDGPLAGAVVGRSAFDTPGSWEAMVRAVRNLGRRRRAAGPDLDGPRAGLPARPASSPTP